MKIKIQLKVQTTRITGHYLKRYPDVFSAQVDLMSTKCQ